jgi:hypothetical protein
MRAAGDRRIARCDLRGIIALKKCYEISLHESHDSSPTLWLQPRQTVSDSQPETDDTSFDCWLRDFNSLLVDRERFDVTTRWGVREGASPDGEG